MKKNHLNKPIKLRNKVTQDIYFTFHDWPSKEIDGVSFVSVVPDNLINKVPVQKHWMREDSLVKAK
jgi:hypothetical protein